MDAVMSSTHYRTSWQVLSFSSSTRVTSIWRMAALSRSSTAQWDVHARGWEEKIGQLGPTLFPFGYSPLARVVDVVVSSIDFEFRISGFTNSTAEDQQSFQNFDQHRSACTSAACFVPVLYIIKWLPNCWLLCHEAIATAVLCFPFSNNVVLLYYYYYAAYIDLRNLLSIFWFVFCLPAHFIYYEQSKDI
jgi:hypothetical protein